ncbi:MAG: hypothetical protein HYY10_03335 [Candidatus Liptonbacteria bacterium]|nr:hypothetical protein [Candidatus Liptonbacteria bacterium]
MKRLVSWMKGLFGHVPLFIRDVAVHASGETLAIRAEGATTTGQSIGALVGKVFKEMTPEVKREVVLDAIAFVKCQQRGKSSLDELLIEANAPVDAAGNPKPRGVHIHKGVERFENDLAGYIQERATVGGKEAVLADDKLLRTPGGRDAFFARYEVWNDDRKRQLARWVMFKLKSLGGKADRLSGRLHRGALRELRRATGTWHGARQNTAAHRAFQALRETAHALFGASFSHIAAGLVDVVDIAEQMWNSANVWTMLAFRVMVGIGVFTPLILLGFAYIGTPEATGVIAMWFLYGTFIVLPLLWLLAFFNDPWIIGVALVIPTVREALKKLATVVLIGIALEFMWGFFLATVPLELGTRTLTLVLLAVVPVICFALAGKKRLAGWTAVSAALVIAVLAVGGWGAAFAKTKVVAGSAAKLFTGTVTLGPGSGRINVAPDTREIVVMVPPGDWTMGVPRPQGATCFWAKPNDTVEIAKYYADGTSVWLHGLQPYMKVLDTKEVTEMRFRNSSHSEAVRVYIQFKG